MPQKIKTLKTSDWFHEDGFPIVVEPRNPQQPFGLHNHEFCEIAIITGGTGLHVTGELSWPISSGDAFVISGQRPHTYKNMENLSLVNILFQPAKLSWEEQELFDVPGYHALFALEPTWRVDHEFESRLRLSQSDLANVMLLVDQLENELEERSLGFRCMASGLFMQITCYLSRCYGRKSCSDSQSLLRIAEAISHLETHYREPINLEGLARIAHMHERGLLRAFKKALGLSPIAYLIRVRVSRATELLRNEDMSITDVAFELNYEDSSYFSRQFQEIMGMTPRNYRSHLLQARSKSRQPAALFKPLPHSG